MGKAREVPVNDESGKIEYHQGFYAAMRLEYDSAPVEIRKELQLGDQPVRLDLLIIKLNDGETLPDPIGRFFRKYNVVEYKSPDDSLNIDDFIKAQSYAGFYKSFGRKVNEIPMKALTVSLVRHAFPRDLFSDLKDEGFAVEERSTGIFYVAGPLCFPTQVVVTSQLPAGGYEALKVLTRNARKEDIILFLQRSETDESYARYAAAILQVSIAANEDLYHKLEQEGVMMGAFERVFYKELAEARNQGLSQGHSEGAHQAQEGFVMRMLTAGKLALKEIAEYSGLTLAQVKAIQKSMA